jgi:hypothetical protein
MLLAVRNPKFLRYVVLAGSAMYRTHKTHDECLCHSVPFLRCVLFIISRFDWNLTLAYHVLSCTVVF